jgi:hypothetical protein
MASVDGARVRKNGERRCRRSTRVSGAGVGGRRPKLCRSQPTGGERKFISDKAPAITARRTKLRERETLALLYMGAASTRNEESQSQLEARANDNEIADLFIDRIDPSSRHCLVS